MEWAKKLGAGLISGLTAALLMTLVLTQETTLRCISNQVGDGLMSNAVWKGIPLRNLIEAAGAKQGVGRSAPARR